MSTNNTEKKYLEFPKLSKDDTFNDATARFEPFYKELWFEANKRTPIAQLRADVAELLKKATIDEYRLGASLIENEYTKVVAGAPLAYERRNVAFQATRMVLNFALPMVLFAAGFVFGWMGALVAAVFALALFKKMDEALNDSMDKAQYGVYNIHFSNTHAIANALAVPVEKITPALLAEMHKAFVPWRAKQLKRRAEHEANMARLGLAGGRRMGQSYAGGSGARGSNGSDSGADMHTGPAFNINGTPMVPGTGMDIHGHVFGQD